MIPGVPSNYQNPTRYVGPNARIVPIVTGTRRPDINDVNYLLGTIWRVGKNPSTGLEGEYWILSLLDNTGATWIQLASAIGITTDLRADDGNIAIPLAGIIDVRGLDVSAMSQPIRTTSTIANTLDINIQRSSAGLVGNPQLCGIAYFDSSQFTVDTNGFVQIAAGMINLTQFTTDDGNTPVPTAGGNFNLLSAVVANAANPQPIWTDGGTANTAIIEIQRSTANLAGQPLLAGISYFNQSQFTCDTDGFVSLIGSGPAMTSFTTDDGNTVVPDAMGDTTFIGNVVANSANPKPLFSDGAVANTVNYEIQLATASAAADVNLAGICYFDDTQFAVDAITGQVTLAGLGLAVTNVLTDDGAPAVVPNVSGQLEILGGTNISVTGQGPGNTVTITATGVASFQWNEVAINTVGVTNNGYIMNAGAVIDVSLPTTAAVGEIFEVTGKGAGGWTISQAAGQTIHFGNQDTTTGAGGSLASTNQYDSVRLLCTTANTDFNVLSSIGNITVT